MYKSDILKIVWIKVMDSKYIHCWNRIQVNICLEYWDRDSYEKLQLYTKNDEIVKKW